MAVRWTGNLLLNIEQITPKVQRFMGESTRFHAARATTYMRTNASWTDRTTNARNGLLAEAVTSPFTYSITVGHSMPYGIWLEVRWGGRYAIIPQTVDSQGKEFFATARRVMEVIR